VFGDYLRRGLVFAESLERTCPNIAVAGPSRKLDLGDQFGFQPMDARSMKRRGWAFKRILVDIEKRAAAASH
jgi:hypothetical protein